jgi:hypothetical protein
MVGLPCSFFGMTCSKQAQKNTCEMRVNLLIPLFSEWLEGTGALECLMCAAALTSIEEMN